MAYPLVDENAVFLPFMTIYNCYMHRKTGDDATPLRRQKVCK